MRVQNQNIQWGHEAKLSVVPVSNDNSSDEGATQAPSLAAIRSQGIPKSLHAAMLAAKLRDGSPEEAAREAFKQRFAALAKDPTRFHQLMQSVYDSSYDRAAAESLRQRALAGDYSWLPKVEFVSEETLAGGLGAYDSQSQTVYLSEALKGDPNLAAKTFAEEVGHHIDTLVSHKDTAGDEGELFQKLLYGEKIDYAEYSRLRAENDNGVIYVNGRAIEVEFKFGSWVKKAAKKVAKGVKKAAKKVADGAKSVATKLARSSLGKWVTGVAKRFAKSPLGQRLISTAKKIGTRIKAAARKAVDALKAFGRKIGNGVKKGASWLSKVGKKIAGGLKKAVQWVSNGLQKLGARIASAARGVFKAIVTTLTGIVFNYAEAFTDFFKGWGEIFKGNIAKGLGKIGMSWVKTFIQTPADALIMLFGGVVQAIQTIFFIEPEGRRLTEAEIAVLRDVYGDSIDYSTVIIKENDNSLFTAGGGVSGRTHGNTIYMEKQATEAERLALLVHEMAHVWQNQNGGTDYASEALWGQIADGDDAYNWRNHVPGTPWSELSPEIQAELIEYAYTQGFFSGATLSPPAVHAYVVGAMADMQQGKGAP